MTEIKTVPTTEARRYTVVGLIDNTDQPPRLTVAAVLAGEVDVVDQESGEEDAQRWAETIEADDPQHAEELARQIVAGEE